MKKVISISVVAALILCLMVPDSFGQKVSKTSGLLTALSTWTDLISGTGNVTISAGNTSGTNSSPGAIAINDALFDNSNSFIGIVAAIPTTTSFTLQNAALTVVSGTAFKKQGTTNSAIAPAPGDYLVIRNGHTITVDVAFSSVGTIVNNGSISTTSPLTFNSPGTYIHYQNGGIIPTATWVEASNCRIIGITSISPAGLDQNFGNFVWDCPNQTVNGIISGLNGMTVKGNFNLVSTGAGVVTLSNTITINGNLTISAGTIDVSAGNYQITLGGNWINLNGGDGFAERGGTVILNGCAIQSISKPVGTGGEFFYNLLINNPGGISLADNNITAINTLSLIDGNINANGRILALNNPATGALIQTSGQLSGGFFRRAVNTTTGSYLFPVGTKNYYNSFTIQFNSVAPAGFIDVQFLPGDPLGGGLPLSENGVNIYTQYTDGYWSVISSTGYSSTYDLTLNSEGFTSYSIDQSTRIIKRTDSGNWALSGTYSLQTPPLSKRTGMTGIDTPGSTTYFGLGKSDCITITTQPSDVNTCNGQNVNFSVAAVGTGLTYRWQKNGVDLSDISPFSNTGTPAMMISNVSPADIGSYSCRITSTCSGSPVAYTRNASLNFSLPFPTLGYKYFRTITIDQSMVQGLSDLTNFPVLISGTYPFLRTVANGGQVQNANGYDIVFTDSKGYKLDHQVEKYNPASGEFIAWVRLPLLYTYQNTDLRMIYGNPQVTGNPSVNTVFNSDYRGVWHLNDQNSIIDQTGGGSNGTNNGIGGAVNTAGKIGGALDFENGDGDFITIANEPNFDLQEAITISAWIKVESFTVAGQAILTKGNSAWNLKRDGTNNAIGFFANPSGILKGTVNVNDGNWHYVVGTYDKQLQNLYVDGVLDNSASNASSINLNNNIVNIGDNSETTGNYFDGIMDEPRVLGIARSGSWIKAEFNNQNNPGSFYTIGPESTNSIFGNFAACGNTPTLYSVPNTPGHTYTWTVVGGTFPPTTGNSVYITWGVTGPWNIQLAESSGGCGAPSLVYNVTVTAPPTPVVSGDNDVCPDAAGVVYSTPLVPGNTYTWIYNGGTVPGSYTLNSISVDWSGIGPGTLRVTEFNTTTGCSITTPDYIVQIRDIVSPVIIPPAPVTALIDAGSCTGSGIVLGSPVTTDNCSVGSVVNDAPAVFPLGPTTVTWSVTDRAGNSSTATQIVTINLLPAPILTSSDSDNKFCAGTSVTFTASAVGWTIYDFRVDGISVQKSSLPTYTTNTLTNGQQVFVKGTNPGGCLATSSVIINTVNAGPAVTFPGSLASQCFTSTTYALSGGTPAGGTYSGPGVTGTNFNASIAGVGTQTITYTYSDVNGCSNSATNTIVVRALPVVGFTGVLAPQCVTSTTYVLSGGTPAGGSYSGPGVTGTNFNASLTGIGSHTITYSFTDINGCTNSATNTIVVTALPIVTFPGLFEQQCVTSTTYLLSGGTPAGGTYSGPGVTGTNFNAAVAGLGTHTITYSYTDVITGCTNTATKTIVVRALPVVTFSNFLAFQCVSSTTYSLTGGSPSGGTYSGPGVTGTNFDASVAGVGTHTITYSFTNASGCTSTATNTIIVKALPVVTFTGVLASQCISSTTYNLSGGSPEGGTYSGPGVTGTNFNASIAGAGTHTITYSFIDDHGCEGFATNTIVVRALPVVTFPGVLALQCITSTTFVLSGGSPAGGTYNGPGVAGTNFNASVAGIGTHTVTYSYTDVNGCTNTATNTLVVNALPVVTFPGSLTPQCILSTSYTLNGGNPAGGTYSGTGVTGTTFNASVAGLGTHSITYTYTDIISGCSNTATNTIVVNILPVVTFPGPLASQCLSSATYTLSGGSPAGGTYTGPGVTGTNFNASVAGVGAHTITYRYTDVSGCTNTATNSIVVRALPVVTFPGSLASQCLSSTTYALNGGTPAGGTYSGPGVTGTNFSAMLAGAGTHIITYSYSDVNGCTNSATNTIVVNAPPVVSFPGILTSQCVSSTAYLLTGGTPAGGIYSGPGVTGTNFNASLAGAGIHTITYSFTDVDGCSNSVTNTIIVNALPIPTFTTQPGAAVCSNTDATYTTEPGQSNYIWTFQGVLNVDYRIISGGTTADNTVTLKWLTSGSKTITVNYTSGAGCSGTSATSSISATVTDSPTVSDAGPDQTGALMCGLTSTVLAGNTPVNGTGFWSIISGTGGVIAVPGSPTSTFSGTSGTAYVLRWTISNSLCAASVDEVNIKFNQKPALTSTQTNVLCYGTSTGVINITASGGTNPYTFSWTGAGVIPSSEDQNGLGAGSYSVMVTDANGCTSPSLSLTITQPLAALTGSITTQNNVTCSGSANGSVTLTGSGGTSPYMFSISGGAFQSSGTFNGLSAATYTVSIRDANLCTVNVIATISQPAAVSIAYTSEDVSCPGVKEGSIRLTITGGLQPYNAIWSDGITTLDRQNISDGTYSVVVTDKNGCAASLSITISFTVSDKCLVIPDIITPNNDGYNDTWQILNIDLFPDAEVFVYDRWGKLVFRTKNISANPWDGTFNGKLLPTDSYHYVLFLNDGSKPKSGVISIIR